MCKAILITFAGMNPTTYKFTDLIINPNGSIYHLHLKPGQVAPTVILVGDPARVGVISRHFDRMESRIRNRELLSHTGYLGNKRVTVLSTGMGTDNIDIVVHELDALVNIDFRTRTRKKEHTRLSVIRIGTSGAIQPEVPLNAFVLSEYAIGIDGLLNYYDHHHRLEEELADTFREHIGWPKQLPLPYAAKGSDFLTSSLGDGLLRGITLTAQGFYGPQGRSVRIPLAFPDLNERIASFAYKGKKIINYEMETAALYGLCTLLGHEALTICVAIANRATNQFDPEYQRMVRNLVELFVERLRNLQELP
ncbi:MAG TPA: nucleoside phosphorylase [Bacteroidales bacterium]|nr:nucleoside phosphorylase [Bacteroidales bacterium]HNS47597.1 nucleoside phosphorylase [Bacteroidales bacterium]